MSAMLTGIKSVKVQKQNIVFQTYNISKMQTCEILKNAWQARRTLQFSRYIDKGGRRAAASKHIDAQLTF